MKVQTKGKRKEKERKKKGKHMKYSKQEGMDIKKKERKKEE
jgi:hypothetical protein